MALAYVARKPPFSARSATPQACKLESFLETAGNELGHTFLEVWYGGRWHVLDTMTAFYVLTRDSTPVLANIAELSADSTLVTKAPRWGRCGPEFLYCLRQRELNHAMRQKMVADGMREDIAWTLFAIAPDENGNPQDIRTFWIKDLKHPSYMDPQDAYGARYEPGLLDITLKPNEEYVRLWDNVGRWMPRMKQLVMNVVRLNQDPPRFEVLLKPWRFSVTYTATSGRRRRTHTRRYR